MIGSRMGSERRQGESSVRTIRVGRLELSWQRDVIAEEDALKSPGFYFLGEFRQDVDPGHGAHVG